MAHSADALAWVKRAEGDADAAITLMRQFSPAAAHVIAYLAQQCAEKYLKAVLVMNGISFPRTHDLARLITLASEQYPALVALRPAAALLQPYAVDIRYPGNDPDQAACEAAIDRMHAFRAVCRSALGIPPK